MNAVEMIFVLIADCDKQLFDLEINKLLAQSICLNSPNIQREIILERRAIAF